MRIAVLSCFLCLFCDEAHAQNFFQAIENGIRSVGEGIRHVVNEADKIRVQVQPVDIDFRNGGVARFNWGGVADTRYDPRNGSWQTSPGIIPRAPVDISGGAIGQVIRFSRDRARTTSQPIPPWVRQLLAPFFSADVLDRAHYTFDWGATANLTAQATALGSGQNNAISLIDTIVFRNRVLEGDSYSRNQPFPVEQANWSSIYLWAHELTHLEQYKSLGAEDFGKWVVKDYYGQLENPAQSNGHRIVAVLAQTMSSRAEPQSQCPSGTNSIMSITHTGGVNYLYVDCHLNAYVYDPDTKRRLRNASGRVYQYGNAWVAVDITGLHYWAEKLAVAR
ncbi:MAG: hypothetical protein QM757_06785 [Paludibaculum sp.]